MSACFFGLGLMFTPDQTLKIYASLWSEIPDFAIIAVRGWGGLILSLGIALFSAIKASESYGRRALLIVICLGNGLLVLINLYATLTGIENSMGWTLVAVLAVLTIWGGVLLIREKVSE
ncbi:MAG: hypothetical protein IPL46_18310 [Saprospiraceae bacterium]|nr:hypothetical protein [Saprospiraceae bacterium]